MNLTITHKFLSNILDNLNDENFNDFLVELQYSTLIVPVSYYNEVPVVENSYVPLFTDFYEFDKFNKGNEFLPIDHDFNYYLHLLKDKKIEGFTINPDSENYEFSREILEHILPSHIFDQEYQVFTTNEIRQIKYSIDNRDLNEFLKDKKNWWDLDTLVEKLNDATLLILLVSDEDYNKEAEDGVISPLHVIPKCLYESGAKNYLLLFSREISSKSVTQDIYKYSQIVNFPLLVESILNDDLDGIILNIDEENITIPRQHLRNFMRDFSIPLLCDFSMYAFTVNEGE